MDPPSRLSYLFGTEEYVEVRKQLVLLREKCLNYINMEKSCRIVCGGSLSEGVMYPTSDDDLMFYSIAFQVVKTDREATRRYDVVMDSTESSPGYCLLYDVNKSFPEYMTIAINQRPFLSSTAWKQSSLRDEEYIHGPCGSGTLGSVEFDFASGLSVSFWPEIASDWLSKKRSWPSNEMIQNISTNGCHVVPIGDPDSPFSPHEWRISFLIGERKLLHSFNHAQFLTYNLLRLTLKRILEKEAQDVFCSYFMKNTLFYTIEKVCAQTWCLNNMEPCYRSCMSVLYDFVDHLNLPNYFMPDYNMIRRKINRKNQNKILGIIRFILKIGIVGVIRESDESQCLVETLSLSFMEWKLDKEYMLSFLFSQCSVTVRNMFSKCVSIGSTASVLCEVLYLLGSDTCLINSNFMSIFEHKAIHYYCERMMNFSEYEQNHNKQTYCIHKTMKYLLRISLNGDVTTGKLTIATYLNLTGKVKGASSVIRQLLLECPSYFMDSTFGDIERRKYIDLMCGRKYSINFKARHAWAPMYPLFSDTLKAWPFPMRILISACGTVDLNPLTYAYTLESLCYVKLQSEPALKRSTSCLFRHIVDALDDGKVAVFGRMCMGIIKYTNKEDNSACRWIGAAYILKDTILSPHDKGIASAALTYVACLLNRQLN